MPYFSYHGGHSGKYCRHARDGLRAIVERAIELGFSHYGLSEHCPRDRAQDMYSDETDLSPADLQRIFTDYATEARGLQSEFADRIELLVGMETERLPPEGWQTRMAQLRDAMAADYVVGSVHEVDGIWVDYDAEHTARAAEHCGGTEALRIRYFERLAELVTSLRPQVVGHLDLVRRFDPEPQFSAPEIAAATKRSNCGIMTEAVKFMHPPPHCGAVDKDAGALAGKPRPHHFRCRAASTATPTMPATAYRRVRGGL